MQNTFSDCNASIVTVKSTFTIYPMTEFDATFKQLSNAAEKVHISPSFCLD